MSKSPSLGRLRDISKQRSIRRPLLVPVPKDTPDDPADFVPCRVEWPIPSRGLSAFQAKRCSDPQQLWDSMSA
jgi:hypothetical protein